MKTPVLRAGLFTLLMVIALLSSGCATDEIDQGFATVIGMTLAYIASFMGLGLAWWSYRKHHPPKQD